MSESSNNINKLNEIVFAKGEEWKSLLQQQNESLSEELQKTANTLKLEKLRFLKLKEDFEFNLNVLRERDEELDKYEDFLLQIKANENLQNEEISQMKIKVDENEIKLKRAEREKEELRKHYQMRLADFQDDVSKCYAKKDSEMQLQAQEFENMKLQLELKIRDLEENVVFEKQKIMDEYNETLRTKQKEYFKIFSKKNEECHAAQLKAKMLKKELELVRSDRNQVEENLKNDLKTTVNVQQLLKEREYEIEDITSMNKIKVKELEDSIYTLKKTIRDKDEEYSRKYSEFQKSSSENELILSKIKDAAADLESNMHKEMKKIVKKNEELELKVKHLSWEKDDILKEKSWCLEKKIEEIANLESKLQYECQNHNQLVVTKDREMESLKTSESQLRTMNEQMKFDLQGCKKDLSSSLDRERILENAKTQLELDWRKRVEMKENEMCIQHEMKIQKINNSKEEVESSLRKKEEDVNKLRNEVKILNSDKELAVNYLEKIGIKWEEVIMNNDSSVRTSELPETLADQNGRLKEVIADMRNEMEILNKELENTSMQNVEGSSDYVKELETELSTLKANNRSLKERLNEVSKDQKPPLRNIDCSKISDPSVRNYLVGMNQTLTALRNEKVQLQASLKSKDATIQHLNTAIANHEADKKQQQLSIETLKFDLNSNQKIYEQTNNTLKNRISEVELHLQQSRSEAEAYYKTLLERNAEPSFPNQVLRPEKLTTRAIDSHMNKDEIAKLKEKLKVAIEKITELTKERGKLINIGNKMRAELAAIRGGKTKVETTNNPNENAFLIQQEKPTVDESIDLPLNGSFNEKTSEKNMEAQLKPIDSPLDTNESTSSSLKEIWKLLDKDDISTINSSDNQPLHLNIKGKAVDSVQRDTQEKSTKKKTPKIPKPKSKIRNYNVKT